MYELFNEEHLRKNPKINEIIGSLNSEELKLFTTIMRFGRILRTKNKVIILHIKLDSSFLKYLEIGEMAHMDTKVEKKKLRFKHIQHNLCAICPHKRGYGVVPEVERPQTD